MKKDTLDQVGIYSANLSAIEVGLGSLLHGFKIPFSGQALSLNQGMILSHALKKLKGVSSWTLFLISAVAAVLKSLSPTGRKLGPMVSISMQGFLYSTGVGLFGCNPLGVFIGMGLLSLWAFIQPLLTYLLFYGVDFLQAIQFYSEKMAQKFGLTIEQQWGIFVGIVAFKFLLAGVLGLFVFIKGRENPVFIKSPKWIRGQIDFNPSQDVSTVEVIKLTFKDLMRPLFLLSFSFMIIFFFFMKHSWAEIIALSLRPLGIAFLFFFISRHPFFYSKLKRLNKYKIFEPFFYTLNKTRTYLSENP